MTAPASQPAREVDAIAIGASAGGIDALFFLLQDMPAGGAVPIVTVLHLSPDRDSQLVDIFRARLSMPVHEAQPHAPLAAGTLYFAPPGYHLLVEPDRTFSLSCDEPVLYSRPSIDVLLQSCAEAYGERLAAFVLTGANDDGANGLAAVAAAGGFTVAQDPADARHGTMPAAAIRRAAPDLVLPLAGIRALLHTLMFRT
ncbi:chemotaxis protein CheB [Ramlibacter sp.]|uniref:chemotaxis protein CheB n=1 Tax=Ramlibacter sp. TaxID=1917967 RepID=UPI001829D3F5|nr:chemotaxis protein CheB [Ramlibacter sp.]MBA2673791.1 chemotaxis protein CheB [Ramlibacter sp.]